MKVIAQFTVLFVLISIPTNIWAQHGGEEEDLSAEEPEKPKVVCECTCWDSTVKGFYYGYFDSFCEDSTVVFGDANSTNSQSGCKANEKRTDKYASFVKEKGKCESRRTQCALAQCQLKVAQ